MLMVVILVLESDGTLTYNPSTGKVTATGFVGTLTGNVTGNVAGNLTGTVATATQNSITTMTGLTTVGAAGTLSTVAGIPFYRMQCNTSLYT